jgi:hypothetical protein
MLTARGIQHQASAEEALLVIPKMLATPKISISCPTSYTATTFEDTQNHSAAG